MWRHRRDRDSRAHPRSCRHERLTIPRGAAAHPLQVLPRRGASPARPHTAHRAQRQREVQRHRRAACAGPARRGGGPARGHRRQPARRGRGARRRGRLCAYGESTFALGCTVRTGDDRLELDVEVQVEPDVQIISEELRARPAGGRERSYLVTDPRSQVCLTSTAATSTARPDRTRPSRSARTACSPRRCRRKFRPTSRRRATYTRLPERSSPPSGRVHPRSGAPPHAPVRCSA